MPVVLIAVLFSNNRNSEGRIKRHCSAIGPMAIWYKRKQTTDVKQ
jgi:hypothetical protein